MISIKSERELKIMRQACVIAANVLNELCQMARIGISTWEIDRAAKDIMEKYSCRSASYKYKCGSLKYPGYICVSVNDEIIHGIGTPERVLKSGDIVSMDVCVVYQGFVGDNTRTVVIGEASPEVLRLVKTTEESMYVGIAQALAGNRIGDISAAIQKYVEDAGYSVIREFTGHGVGRHLHEEPEVPNYGKAGTGALLRPGMTIAIEPMVAMGKPDIKIGSDGWTVYTLDGKPSSHSEHTVLITDGEPEILTVCK